jgi:hypothetical protein
MRGLELFPVRSPESFAVRFAVRFAEHSEGMVDAQPTTSLPVARHAAAVLTERS